MEAGDKVRLKRDPGRVGILSNQKGGSPRRPKVLVNFLDGTEEFVLPGALEKLERDAENPYSMIQRGRFGRVSDLRGAVTYYRLNGRLANLIYSLNATNTQFLAYQFKPVLQFLDSPSDGILIADEVGLGKTIEAGLIWTELRARRDARRLLVVCPAMLREKWRLELANRFGVRAEIVDAGGLLQALQEAERDPATSFALVVSIQGVRPGRDWDDKTEPAQTASARLARYLDDLGVGQALLDMIVVDEAHYLRNQETQTYRLGELLRPLTQALVLLSATPVQTKNRDLFNLVRLLDLDAFPTVEAFEWTLRANAPMVTLRDRVRGEELTQAEFVAAIEAAQRSTFNFYQDSEQLRYMREHPPSSIQLASPRGRAELAERLDRINPLSKIITRTLKRDVQEGRVEREPHLLRAPMSPVEEAFYTEVTTRVREFCADLSVSSGLMLTIPQRQMASCMAAACRRWLQQDHTVEDTEEIAYELGHPIAPRPHAKKGVLLVQLQRIARTMGNYEELAAHDGKYARLRDALHGYWAEYPGRKVVLFSFFKDTLHYLAERLGQDGISSVVLHGGMDKQEALEQFESAAGPDILLSSEVLAEGVDLQFSSLVVNYDLPWNPARIEQRIGRVDRIGQVQPKILIWNIVNAGTIDERIHDRLLARLDLFRTALGSMEEILGQEIDALTRDLLSHKLTKKQEEARIDSTMMAIANAQQIQQQVARQAVNLIAHGDFIRHKVEAANDLGRFIRSEDLLAYVRDFLVRQYSGTRVLQEEDGLYRLELSTEARVDFAEFLEDERLTGRTQLLTTHPPRLKFDNAPDRPAPGVERVGQEHPLVRFVGHVIRGTGGNIGYLPVSAIAVVAAEVPHVLPGAYVYQVARWSITGARQIERLEYLAKSCDSHATLDGDDAERLVNAAAHRGRDWLGAASELNLQRAADLQDDCQEELRAYFEQFAQAQERENKDRVRMMQDSLQRDLDRRTRIIEERIAKYRVSGERNRLRMIPAEQGKLDKERKRVQERLDELQLKLDIQLHESAVSCGVIRVS